MTIGHESPSYSGQLAGHRVRFNGMEGRAGTFDTETKQYFVTMDEGFSRTVSVGEKYLEDLGTYTSPIERVPDDFFRDVPCTGSSEGNEHTAKVVAKTSLTESTCTACRIAIARNKQEQSK